MSDGEGAHRQEWEYAQSYWSTPLQDDPRQEGHLNSRAKDGWELVTITSTPVITWESPEGFTYAGSFTQATIFVATWRRRLATE